MNTLRDSRLQEVVRITDTLIPRFLGVSSYETIERRIHGGTRCPDHRDHLPARAHRTIRP